MAGDWIKVEENMPDKPEVCAIAARLGIDVDAVTGKLFRVWAWATRNCNADGVTSVTVKSYIDRITAVTGFADAMLAAGWLVANGDTLAFPNFDRHCSQTAKERAHTQRRVQKHRSVGNGASVTDVTDAALPKRYQRREEKRREKNTQRAPAVADALPGLEGEPKQDRQRNPLFDALAAVDGANPAELTKRAASAVGVALAEIRKATPDVTPEEITRRATNYRARNPEWSLTPSALASHWAACATASTRASTWTPNEEGGF